MPQIRFDPELVDWWQLLRQQATRLGRVHVWHPEAHPPGQRMAGIHQNPTVTLVLCLAGVVRIADDHATLDLRSGDALLIHPGSWHRHEPVRTGSLAFGLGYLADHCDYAFHSSSRMLAAMVPPQPGRQMMEDALAAEGEAQRRQRLARLLGQLVAEASEPLATPDPALLRMELALWNNLHRRGGAELLVRASGVARNRAFRLCRERWGAGPAAVLRRERLRLAESLLAAGLPVAEVTWRCGFASRQVFTRARRRAALPPATRHP